MRQTDIDNNFIYHASSPRQVKIYENLRNNGKELVEYINSICPDGREKSVAITKIEEAIMWANASIAREDRWM